MKQATIRLLTVLLIGLVFFSTMAMAREYFRVYRGSRGYGYSYVTPYSPPLVSPSGAAAGGYGTTAQTQPATPQVKEVTVRVKDLRTGQPIANATVEIYAQVGLGTGELRGSGATNVDGTVVIPDIKYKWHVIVVKAPGKPLSGFHYLPPFNRSDTFRV